MKKCCLLRSSPIPHPGCRTHPMVVWTMGDERASWLCWSKPFYKGLTSMATLGWTSLEVASGSRNSTSSGLDKHNQDPGERREGQKNRAPGEAGTLQQSCSLCLTTQVPAMPVTSSSRAGHLCHPAGLLMALDLEKAKEQHPVYLT